MNHGFIIWFYSLVFYLKHKIRNVIIWQEKYIREHPIGGKKKKVAFATVQTEVCVALHFLLGCWRRPFAFSGETPLQAFLAGIRSPQPQP